MIKSVFIQQTLHSLYTKESLSDSLMTFHRARSSQEALAKQLQDTVNLIMIVCCIFPQNRGFCGCCVFTRHLSGTQPPLPAGILQQQTRLLTPFQQPQEPDILFSGRTEVELAKQ